MVKKKISVRKHKRHLPSGKITTVKAHTRRIDAVRPYTNYRDAKKELEDDSEEIKEKAEDLEEVLTEKDIKKVSKKWNKIIERHEESTEKDRADLNNLILEQNIVNLNRALNEKELDDFAKEINSRLEKNDKQVITTEDAKYLNSVVNK